MVTFKWYICWNAWALTHWGPICIWMLSKKMSSHHFWILSHSSSLMACCTNQDGSCLDISLAFWLLTELAEKSRVYLFIWLAVKGLVIYMTKSLIRNHIPLCIKRSWDFILWSGQIMVANHYIALTHAYIQWTKSHCASVIFCLYLCKSFLRWKTNGPFRDSLMYILHIIMADSNLL